MEDGRSSSERGHSAERAVMEIYNIYGHSTSLSKIMNTMIRDRRHYRLGIHPNLR